MALTIKLDRLSSQLLCRSRIYLCSTTRYYSSDTPKPWYHLWRPGKYSEKDHDKIAEKYNLHPKEYKPYPNNEKYLGDYPALPAIGSAVKDPYYPYDIPTHRKNYQETIHDEFEIMGEDRLSVGEKRRYELGLGVIVFLSIMTVSFTIYMLLEPYPTIRPWMEKQYPKKGVVHYTFEPAK